MIPGPVRGRGRGRAPRFSLDGALIFGVILVAIGFSALIIKGFKEQTKRDELLADLASIDPYYNGGYPQLDVNTATPQELARLPWMTEEIAEGIVERRERQPFRLSEELLEVRGIRHINLEMFRLYLYGFEDQPEPRVIENRPLGVPDA